CLLALRIPAAAPLLTSSRAKPAVDSPRRASPRQALAGAIGDASKGLRYVFSSPWLWVTALAAPLIGPGFATAMWVTLPTLVRVVYHQKVWWIGAVAREDAMGSIVAAAGVGSMPGRRRGLTAYGAVLLGGVALIACVLPLPPALQPAVVILASALIGGG